MSASDLNLPSGQTFTPGSYIELRANNSGSPMTHDEVDGNFELLRTRYNTLKADLDALVGGAIETTAPAALTIDGGKLVAGSVSSTELGAASVGSSELIALSVTGGTTTASKIAADTIHAYNMAANSVGASELANDAVDTAAIVDDAVSFSKVENIATDTILGRTTANSGVIEELTVSAVQTLLSLHADATSAGGYSLPIATSSALGGIKIGANLTINSSTGVLDAAAGGGSVALQGYSSHQGDSANAGLGLYTKSLAAVGDGAQVDTTVTLGGNSVTNTVGELYVVNDVTPLKVYIDASLGTEIGGDYGTNGNGGMAGMPFRGVCRDPGDSRFRAIPKEFINYGQAEKYVNFWHPGQTEVQFIFTSDVTETLYSSTYNSATNLPELSEHKRIVIKSKNQNRWTVTFESAANIGRAEIIDVFGTHVRFQNLQIVVTNAQNCNYLARIRGGGHLQLQGYLGVKMMGDGPRYGVWSAGGSTIYDFSYGDYLKTDQTSQSFIYTADWGSNILQYPHFALGGVGDNAYITDGRWGVAKLAGGARFTLTSYSTAHTGGEDHGLGWDSSPTNLLGQTTKIMSSGVAAENVYVQQGPYLQFDPVNGNNYGSSSVSSWAYDPSTHTGGKDPSFLVSGVGNYVDFASTGIPQHSETEPIGIDAFKFSSIPGSAPWGYGYWNTAASTPASTLQWDSTAYGFTADDQATINLGITLSRPIHSVSVALSAPKFRAFHMYKKGAAHADSLNTTGAWAGTVNPLFPTSNIFHADANVFTAW